MFEIQWNNFQLSSKLKKRGVEHFKSHVRQTGVCFIVEGGEHNHSIMIWNNMQCKLMARPVNALTRSEPTVLHGALINACQIWSLGMELTHFIMMSFMLLVLREREQSAVIWNPTKISMQLFCNIPQVMFASAMIIKMGSVLLHAHPTSRIMKLSSQQE